LGGSSIRISRYNKALTQLRLQRFSEAKTTLETALRADPESRKIKAKLDDIGRSALNNKH